MVTWLHLNDNNCGWQANQNFFFKGNLYLVVHDLALSTDSFFKGPYRKANIIIFAKLHILFVTWRNWIGLFYVRHFHCRWRVSEWTKNLHSNNFLKPPQFLQYDINFLHGFWRILPKTCCFLCERSYLRLIFGVSVFCTRRPNSHVSLMYPYIISARVFLYFLTNLCKSYEEKTQPNSQMLKNIKYLTF